MTDNTETKTVAVDTENLEDFEDLFQGKANPAEDTEDNDLPEDDTSEEDDLATEETEEEEKEEVEEPKPEPKKKKSAQERINELTRERREAERREAELMKRLEALESKDKPEVKEAVLKAPTPDDVDANGEPKYPLGEFDPAFARDNVKFILAEERKQAEAAEVVNRQQREAQAEFERISSDWNKKIEGVEERLPDFSTKSAELVDAFQGIDPAHGDFLASTIMSLEYGPEVLYYLSENLDVAERITKLSPTAAVIQLGRLEAQFLPKKEVKPKVTVAPEPPPTATRGTGTRAEVAVDTDDLDAFTDMFYKKRK